VILNPGFMLGPGASAASRVTTSRLVQLFCQRGIPVFVGGGGHSFCDVRDVARAHVAALVEGTRASRYIVGGKNLGLAQFLRLMSEQTGIRTPRPIAAPHAFAAAAAMDGLSAASFGLWRSPIHRSYARALPLYYWGCSAGAERDLGYRSRPVVQTIRETIADFVRRGMVPDEFRYVEAMTDETQVALLLLKQMARGHLHRSHLMARLPRILAACRHNHSLSEALDTALASAIYDPGRGRFFWKGAAPANALRKLRSLLDFCYYASDEFRARVT
jgi:dihydroflavonol-4-reductase